MKSPLVAVVALWFAINAGNATCLTYASRVFVTGTLTRQVFPGPPNYESIARGDTQEIYYVLRFDRPTCVDQDPTDSQLPGIKKLTEMQLVLTHEQYLQLEGKIGRKIGLSGTLFPAETGHHHTPVLLEKVEIGR
jgi:hypothetical protein